jgi:hypothetical protein
MEKIRDPISPQVEWIRPSQVPVLFGISRSVCYELLASGKIESVVLRKRGNLRGCRFINADSIRAFLSGLASKRDTDQ